MATEEGITIREFTWAIVMSTIIAFFAGAGCGHNNTTVRCDECKGLKPMRQVDIFKQKRFVSSGSLETEEDVFFVCKSCQDKIIVDKNFLHKE